MAHVACPFCFIRIDSSKLAYQCTNRGVQECTAAVDPDRVKLTGNATPSYPTFLPAPGRGVAPVCPTCGAEATRRACRACHTALPIHFVDSDSPMIGIVGSKGSGKSILMMVLVKQLREQVGKRFQAAVRMATDNPDGSDGVEAYRINREKPFFDGGVLPLATQEDKRENRRQPVVLLWQGPPARRLGVSRPASTVLSFVDTAGEDLSGLDKTFSLRYLPVCDGLIITLDPFSLPGARARLHLPGAAIKSFDGAPLDVISRITELLRVELKVRKSKKIKLPVAVVFAKMDAFFPGMDRNSAVMSKPAALAAYQEADGQAVHENVRALLHEWDASDVDLHLQLNYSCFRYFGVSALGAEPDYEAGHVDSGGVRPHRVEDPVLWLLAKEGKVATA